MKKKSPVKNTDLKFMEPMMPAKMKAKKGKKRKMGFKKVY